MHVVIPFAAPSPGGERGAPDKPSLPHLERLVQTLSPFEEALPGRQKRAAPAAAAAAAGDADIASDPDDLAYRLTPPHEGVVARALGWSAPDGALPWAARAAAADGIETGEAAWGLLSPVHWHVGRDHLTMGDPEALGLGADESRAFLAVLRPLFESQGWRCEWGAPTRWYVAHESLAGLPTASLDRVIGRNPDLWMPASPSARALRRLQSEAQMLLHTHPLNEAREAAGLDPLNSLWLSGCGRGQPARGESPRVLDALRAPALREDWRAWTEAWRALDAGPLRAALEQPEQPLTLSLCGERRALTLERRPRGLLGRLRAHWRRQPATELLAEL